MKRIITIGCIVLAFCMSGTAQSTPRSLAKKVELAYLYGLGRLDGKKLMNGRLKVVVEDSLSGDLETHNFSSFRSMERWLKKNQRDDGTPRRATGDIGSCTRSRCIVDYNYGILHNHLYLKRIEFGYRNGRRYVKGIRLLDGA